MRLMHNNTILIIGAEPLSVDAKTVQAPGVCSEIGRSKTKLGETTTQRRPGCRSSRFYPIPGKRTCTRLSFKMESTIVSNAGSWKFEVLGSVARPTRIVDRCHEPGKGLKIKKIESGDIR